MASGSLGGRVTYNSSYQYFGLNWSSSADINSNTSTLSISLYFSTSNTSKKWDTVGTRDMNIKVYVNGQQYSSNSATKRIDCDPYKSNPYVILTHSCTIGHNSDGTPPLVQISAYANGTATSGGTKYGPGKSYIDAQSITLDTIPRTSSFSFSGTTLGSNTHININRASSSFTHTVIYSMGNVSQSYTGIGTSCDFTRPYSDANQFGSNSASGTGNITVITYNGGSEIGRTSKSIVMTIPDNNDTKPVLNSLTNEEAVAGIYEKFGAYIQNNSRASFTFNASGRYGAGIRTYAITINNQNLSSSNNVLTTDTLKDSGSVSYTYKITDTRGRSISGSGIISVLSYIKPQISAIIERTTTGTSADVKIIASITSLNDLNDKSVAVKYKQHLDETYDSVSVSFDDNSYTMDKTISIPISENSSYDFYVACIDYFGEEDTAIIPISTVFDLMHFANDGESMAIGKRSEINGALEIGLDLYYKGMTIDDYINQIIDERNGA